MTAQGMEGTRHESGGSTQPILQQRTWAGVVHGGMVRKWKRRIEIGQCGSGAGGKTHVKIKECVGDEKKHLGGKRSLPYVPLESLATWRHCKGGGQRTGGSGRRGLGRGPPPLRSGVGSFLSMLECQPPAAGRAELTKLGDPPPPPSPTLRAWVNAWKPRGDGVPGAGIRMSDGSEPAAGPDFPPPPPPEGGCPYP